MLPRNKKCAMTSNYFMADTIGYTAIPRKVVGKSASDNY